MKGWTCMYNGNIDGYPNATIGGDGASEMCWQLDAVPAQASKAALAVGLTGPLAQRSR